MVKGCSTISIFLKRKGRTRLVGAWRGGNSGLGWVAGYMESLSDPSPPPCPFQLASCPLFEEEEEEEEEMDKE
jgi:hypothetical protein